MAIRVLEDNDHRITWFRQAEPDSIIFKTAPEFIKDLQKNSSPEDILYLDHDLGDEIYVDSKLKNCGMEVVRFLEKHQIPLHHILVHTCNMYAGKVMVSRLRAAGYSAFQHPFSTFDLDLS